MNYDQLIRNWHSKAADEDYFSKFVFQYLAYIAYLMKNKYRDARCERAAIQCLKRDFDVEHSYLRKVQSDEELRAAWDTIKQELDERPLGNVSRNNDEAEILKYWNCSHDSVNRKTAEDNEKQTGVIHDFNDWENMIEFWQAIRNNLFHGTKDPEDNRDRILVKNGYKTLRPIVNIFINNRLHHER
jgi:hypothetical protein